jgi:predicted SnoaL-like aldol condensation-catalyzing enzyme
MKALKMPKVRKDGKGAVALRSRQKAVVAVVVSIAPAARLYVHVNRLVSEPEMLGGITADSYRVLLG